MTVVRDSGEFRAWLLNNRSIPEASLVEVLQYGMVGIFSIFVAMLY